VGNFSGKRTAIILDDEFSTGGTAFGLIQKLVEMHGIEEIYLGVSHNRCVPEARQRLLTLNARYHLKEIVVTNSIPQTEGFRSLPFLSVRCLSDTLARMIVRIHLNRSVSEVFYRPGQD